MAKRLFLFVISMFIGVMNTPGILSAADQTKIADIDTGKMVETVIPEPVVMRAPKTDVAPVIYGDSITILGNTNRIIDAESTYVNAGDHVNKYGEKFLYGHNSAAVFGNLKYLSVGDTFTVNYAGETTDYVVSNVVLFDYDYEKDALRLNGKGSYMSAVAKSSIYLNSVLHNYDLSLMTCAGTPFGDGNATQRLVIFADKI